MDHRHFTGSLLPRFTHPHAQIHFFLFPRDTDPQNLGTCKTKLAGGPGNPKTLFTERMFREVFSRVCIQVIKSTWDDIRPVPNAVDSELARLVYSRLRFTLLHVRGRLDWSVYSMLHSTTTSFTVASSSVVALPPLLLPLPPPPPSPSSLPLPSHHRYQHQQH